MYQVKDRVAETTLTAGTGDLTFVGPLPGCRPWSVASSQICLCCLEEGADWEIFEGYWDAGTSTLTRGALRRSSTGSRLSLSGNGAICMMVLGEEAIGELQTAITSLQGRLKVAGTFSTTFGAGISAFRVATGGGNAGLGHFMGYNLTSGSDGTYLGANSGYNITTGSRNVFLGNRAGEYLGNVSDRLAVGKGPAEADLLMLGNLSSGSKELRVLGNLVVDGDLEVGGSGGKVSPGYTGLRISRASSTQLSIAAGAIHNHDLSASLAVPSAITLDLATAGHFVNGASRATNTWYHALIGHETSSGNVVAGLSEALAKPSGWDDWQMIGAMRTNGTGGGEWDLFEQYGDKFISMSEQGLFSSTAPGISEHTVRMWCPPGRYDVDTFLRYLDAGGADYVLVRTAAGGTHSLAMRIGTGSDNVQFTHPSNASGNFVFRLLGGTTFAEFNFHGRSFRYPIGEAGSQ